MNTHAVAVADDHILMRSALATLVNSFSDYQVIFQAANGEDVIHHINNGKIPEVLILDINMPLKDGFETALWMKTHHPEVKILALSMYEKDISIIRMIRNGVKGYILKAAEPSELKEALDAIIHKGFHYSPLVTGHLLHSVQNEDKKQQTALQLTEREIQFLKYACTELTYKQIAEKMYVSPRTVDGYRDSLFEKLNVETRVGLVIYAIRNGIVNIEVEL